jgi:hypothetical protein
VSQERLREILDAAIDAARAHPAWQPGDELALIAADADATVMTTRGFGPGSLVLCLEQMASDVRRAAAAERPPPPGWTPIGTTEGGGQLYTAPPGTPWP